MINNGDQEIVWRYKTPLDSGWLARNLIGAVEEGMVDFPDRWSFDAANNLVLGPMSFYYRIKETPLDSKAGIFKVSTRSDTKVLLGVLIEPYPVAIGYTYGFNFDADEYGEFTLLYEATVDAFDGLVICHLNYPTGSDVPEVSFEGIKRSESRYQLDGISAEPRLAVQLPCSEDHIAGQGFSKFRFFLKRFNERLQTYTTMVYNYGSDKFEYKEYNVASGFLFDELEDGKFYAVGHKAAIFDDEDPNPIEIIGEGCDSKEEAFSAVYRSFPDNMAYVLLGVIGYDGVNVVIYQCDSSLLKTSWTIMEARRYFQSQLVPPSSIPDVQTLFDQYPPADAEWVNKSLFFAIMDMDGYIAGSRGGEEDCYDMGDRTFAGHSGKVWKQAGDDGFQFFVDQDYNFGYGMNSTADGMMLAPTFYLDVWKFLTGNSYASPWAFISGMQAGSMYGATRELYQQFAYRPGYLSLSITNLGNDAVSEFTGMNIIEINNNLCIVNSEGDAIPYGFDTEDESGLYIVFASLAEDEKYIDPATGIIHSTFTLSCEQTSISSGLNLMGLVWRSDLGGWYKGANRAVFMFDWNGLIQTNKIVLDSQSIGVSSLYSPTIPEPAGEGVLVFGCNLSGYTTVSPKVNKGWYRVELGGGGGGGGGGGALRVGGSGNSTNPYKYQATLAGSGGAGGYLSAKFYVPTDNTILVLMSGAGGGGGIRGPQTGPLTSSPLGAGVSPYGSGGGGSGGGASVLWIEALGLLFIAGGGGGGGGANTSSFAGGGGGGGGAFGGGASGGCSRGSGFGGTNAGGGGGDKAGGAGVSSQGASGKDGESADGYPSGGGKAGGGTPNQVLTPGAGGAGGSVSGTVVGGTGGTGDNGKVGSFFGGMGVLGKGGNGGNGGNGYNHGSTGQNGFARLYSC